MRDALREVAATPTVNDSLIALSSESLPGPHQKNETCALNKGRALHSTRAG
jgi:hypothetical protein